MNLFQASAPSAGQNHLVLQSICGSQSLCFISNHAHSASKWHLMINTIQYKSRPLDRLPVNDITKLLNWDAGQNNSCFWVLVEIIPNKFKVTHQILAVAIFTDSKQRPGLRCFAHLSDSTLTRGTQSDIVRYAVKTNQCLRFMFYHHQLSKTESEHRERAWCVCVCVCVWGGDRLGAILCIYFVFIACSYSADCIHEQTVLSLYPDPGPVKTRSIKNEAPQLSHTQRAYASVCERERGRDGEERAGVCVCLSCLESCRLIGGGCQSQEETWRAAPCRHRDRALTRPVCQLALRAAADADNPHCASMKWHRREAAMCQSVRDWPCEHVFTFTRLMNTCFWPPWIDSNSGALCFG